MSNIDKQALRQLATDAHELGIIKRYSKGLEAQRKFYAAATPLVIRALLDELEALQSFRTAYMEWSDKTDWVQTDKRLDVIKPWGKHRADVMKLYIDHLESKLEAKEEQRANWFQMAEKLGADLDAAERRIAELEARQGVMRGLCKHHFYWDVSNVQRCSKCGISISSTDGKGAAK
ncbi:ead/Ea22-like family protein [Citrobacter koseri]|uniref:ead/Ea22-like family protein n=1 Tax=Citrobacter koseri TaxID=545 RepID=UPI000DF102D4|nr:ead/Ea22-like family protein [Citrobacter koseri]STB30252.1 Uncharacterised protein [Citrobacter koseri]